MPAITGPSAIWLVRHGQSEANVLRDAAERDGLERVPVDIRDADVPLSGLGREQAEGVGAWLAARAPGQAPGLIVSSPYERTRQTTAGIVRGAKTFLDGVDITYDERLRDREMGQLDRLTWAGITARFPAEAERALHVGHYYFRPWGGESWADICLRLRSFLSDLGGQRTGERVLLVTHDVVIQLVRCVLEGLDEHEIVSLIASTPYANCALTVFERDADRYVLTAFNEVAPVAEQGTPVTKEADVPPAVR